MTSSSSSSSSRQQTIEVITTEEAPLPSPPKWSVALTEQVFRSFLGEGTQTALNKIFGDGSIFSPFLFGKFFDPSDAFPLWDFESEVLIAVLRRSGETRVAWYQSDEAYILKAELPAGSGKNTTVKVCVENGDKGKVLEISGQWKQQNPKDDQSKPWDWRSGHWWECGYVRRLELPEDADWSQIEASTNEALLELEIRKSSLA